MSDIFGFGNFRELSQICTFGTIQGIQLSMCVSFSNDCEISSPSKKTIWHAFAKRVLSAPHRKFWMHYVAHVSSREVERAPRGLPPTLSATLCAC